MITCVKCKKDKSNDDFYVEKRKINGFSSYCKTCTKEQSAAHHQLNKDKRREQNKAWFAANPEKIKEKHAKQYAKNPEFAKTRARDWREANKDKVSVAKIAWYKNNPEANKIYSHNRRAREKEVGGVLSADISEKLFALQRGKCACCGLPLGSNYHIDHIMPIALGGANTDDNVQLLRQRCNSQKSAKHPVVFMQQRGFLL